MVTQYCSEEIPRPIRTNSVPFAVTANQSAHEFPIEGAIPNLPPAPRPYGHHHFRAMGVRDVAEIEDITPAKAA